MKKYDYPKRLEIRPVTKPVDATVRVPGSKSITNRALVLAALSSRDSAVVFLSNALQSDDTEAMSAALKALGFDVGHYPDGGPETVSNPTASEVPTATADLIVGGSGTTMRFLAALVSLGFGEYRLSGDERMNQRPIEDLLGGLRQLGVDARSEAGNGCPPVVIRTTGLTGGHVRLRGHVSSQFLSALLLVTPYGRRETRIEIEGPLVSQPYVDMTIKMMQAFGVGVVQPDRHTYRIPAGQRYRPDSYSVEPDATAASYFFAAAAITKGRVRVNDLDDSSIQGDVTFIWKLREMGCLVFVGDESTLVSHPGESGDTIVYGRTLHSITADMNAISDTVMTLAAVACFAEGPTTIRNVAHIRHKECDRITALCTELRKLGVEVEEYPDGLKITPRQMHGAEIETYNDHRMAMSMALIGLKVPGVVIKNPGCVAKTYPGFWEDFQRLYG
jgi:3-phosphoshikimate 1-carboxyvinyltransferase